MQNFLLQFNDLEELRLQLVFTKSHLPLEAGTYNAIALGIQNLSKLSAMQLDFEKTDNSLKSISKFLEGNFSLRKFSLNLDRCLEDDSSIFMNALSRHKKLQQLAFGMSNEFLSSKSINLLCSVLVGFQELKKLVFWHFSYQQLEILVKCLRKSTNLQIVRFLRMTAQKNTLAMSDQNFEKMIYDLCEINSIRTIRITRATHNAHDHNVIERILTIRRHSNGRFIDIY